MCVMHTSHHSTGAGLVCMCVWVLLLNIAGELCFVVVERQENKKKDDGDI